MVRKEIMDTQKNIIFATPSGNSCALMLQFFNDSTATHVIVNDTGAIEGQDAAQQVLQSLTIWLLAEYPLGPRTQILYCDSKGKMFMVHFRKKPLCFHFIGQDMSNETALDIAIAIAEQTSAVIH